MDVRGVGDQRPGEPRRGAESVTAIVGPTSGLGEAGAAPSYLTHCADCDEPFSSLRITTMDGHCVCSVACESAVTRSGKLSSR